MKWRDMIAAVREYPRLQEELKKVRVDMESSQNENQQLKEHCEKLEGQCEWLQEDWNALTDMLALRDQKIMALKNTLCSFGSALDSTEKLRRFYNSLATQFDADGFKLYDAAVELTGITRLHNEFPYEDACGIFENADGHTLLRYLTAAHFGAVRWDIVPGTTYEKATLLELDTTLPIYKRFEKRLYENVVKRMGFEKLLPAVEERKQPHVGLERKDAFER